MAYRCNLFEENGNQFQAVSFEPVVNGSASVGDTAEREPRSAGDLLFNCFSIKNDSCRPTLLYNLKHLVYL